VQAAACILLAGTSKMLTGITLPAFQRKMRGNY
jgi:hypothetical protein